MFFLTLCLTVGGVLMVPYIKVNTDMTKYLPDDSPMKQGLDIVTEQIPGMESQIKELGSTFGNGMDMMPTNLPRTIAIGVAILFLILAIMCTSVVEVLLFLVTTLCAVALNMGTNALRPSVSMMTNMLAPVLQMVLSMDYCIILMNRYRQERTKGILPSEAISSSIAGSAPSVLSSAFTTIASLLMLTFIKIKIGPDFGYVLAKGVAFSLLCNFTVLPALIVWSDKSVIFKVKKTPRFPAERMARFQYKFRIPLAVIFVLVTAAAAILQSRTPIVFAPDWKSKASENAREDNPLMLLYRTSDEAGVPELLQRLQADEHVLSAISYPTTLGRECTVEEMIGMMSEFGAEQLPEELLRIVYYARSHPERDGKLSFAEIEASANKLAAEGKMPEGMNYDKLVAQLMAQAAPVEIEPEPQESGIAADAQPEIIPPGEPEAVTDTLMVAAAEQAQPGSVPAPQAPEDEPEETSKYTYADVTTPLTATRMAVELGADKKQVATVYRLAGKGRGQMSVAEFLDFVREKILANKHYSVMVSESMRERLLEAGAMVDAIVAAGPQDAPRPVAEDAESSPEAEPDDTTAAEVIPESEPVQEPRPEPVEEPEIEPAPLDRLIDMMASGRRYTADRVYSALSAAGVTVSKDDIDLMYLYTLSERDFDPEQTATVAQLVNYLADTLLVTPALARFVPEGAREKVDSVRTLIADNAGMLRGEKYSFAVVSTDYPQESQETFGFVAAARECADSLLPQEHYWIGESEMYKELKDAFPGELLLLTVLTVLAIYLIVAFTFRSVLIPVPLILSVLTGVYVNVFMSGLGAAGEIYFLAYLITQGILMGAAIDYSILYTSYYRRARSTMTVGDAIRFAYEGTSHSVLTSGLILTIVPMVMSYTLDDPMMASILTSLSIGAFTSVVIILLLLPAVLAVMDKTIKHKTIPNES
ncbi:MAG: MMPL family transporter [Bacteroidales bacterium]|nr:MMPL family transporter [Bacteroidales bacterium]